MGTAAPTRSKLERDFRALLREYDLPQPTSNGFIEGIEVDLHWPEHRLIVEIDGYGTHGHQRAFETDRVRDQRLLVAGCSAVGQRRGAAEEPRRRRSRRSTRPGATALSASSETSRG